MTGRSRIVVLVALVAMPGCGSSPPSKYYTLDALATATAPDASASPKDGLGVVAIGPVSIPASVDRPQFVVQLAANRVSLDEFNRWAAPLDENIARVVAADVAALLGERVTTAARANFDPAYQVTIDVQRFDSVLNDAAVLEAIWSVRSFARNTVRAGRTSVREPTKGDGFEALAAAHSRALARLSGDIATAIRAEAGEKR